MPYMPQVQLPDFDQVNALFSNDRNAILHNQALTGTQDLADRATARGLAPALAGSIDPQTGLVVGRDLNALATMATLPGSVHGYNALSEGDARTAAARLGLLEYRMKVPQMPYGPGSTAAAPAGASADSASSSTIQPGQSLLSGETPVSRDAATQNRVGEIAQEEGVNRDWAMRAAHVESGSLPDSMTARGTSGEIGTMQLMPKTAEGLGVNPTDREQNIRGGVRYLAQMKELFGDPVIATAAYNAGPGRVRDWLDGKQPLPRGTIAHVGKVFGTDGNAILNQALSGAHGHPIPGVQIGSHTDGVPVPLPGNQQVASNAGTAGMPTVATDAAGSATVPARTAPRPVLPGSNVMTTQPWEDARFSPAEAGPVTMPATPDTTAALVSGWRQQGAALPPDQRVAVDPSYLANRNAPMEQPGVPLAASAAPPGLQPAPASVAPPAPAQGPGPASVAPSVPAQAAPQQSAEWQPTIPPGALPWTKGGVPMEVPGSPGYTLYQLPNGQNVPIRTTPPKLKIKDAGPLRSFIDPDTGRTLRTEVIPDHSRMQVVPGPNGPQIWQSSQKIAELPASTRPEQAKLLSKDYDQVATLGQQARDFDQQIQKAIEARNYAAGLPTGAGFESRQAAANFLETYWPEASKTLREKLGTLLPDAAQAQSAGKLLLSQAQAEEKAMGGSGGLGLTQMYASANPNLSMQPQAIREMSNLKAVTALSGQDYVQGKIDHVTTHGDEFLNQNGHYIPAAAYDKAWFSQNNRNVYMAAINAINGKPYAEWSKGLQPDEAARALGVVARIDPTGSVSGRNGHPLAVQQFLPANPTNPGGAIVR